MNGKIALAIHGGAGTIRKEQMTPVLEREYKTGLERALKAGWAVLERGGSSLDAVEAAVCELEDFPLFNAGRGSVFTHEGKNEMDAAVMDGRTLDAGSAAFITNVKNPVRLARKIMERSPHIIMAGDGAKEFARQNGIEFADDAYFFTEHRYRQLLEARGEGRIVLDHTGQDSDAVEFSANAPVATGRRPIGTVGAVACDEQGYLAAATSTGGMTNKRYGRVGDSPIIGAGTYADDTCAVSCTGHGEYFIMGVTAYDVSARMKYKNESLESAAKEAIEKMTRIGGEGGLIAVDSGGNVAMPFNSEGMYRASLTKDGEAIIEIY